MTSKPLIRESLVLLNIVGFDFNSSKLISSLKLTILNLPIFTVAIEILLNCVCKWQGFDSMQDVAACVGMYQLFSKIILLAQNRATLNKTLYRMEKFWSIEDNKTLQKEIKILHDFVRLYKKIMLTVTATTITLGCIRPIWLKTKSLPFGSYHPTDINQSPNYEIMYAIQIAAIPSLISSLIGFDLLFLSLIVTLVGELKILKYHFRNIYSESMKYSKSTKGDNLFISEVIRHHDLILECIKDLDKAYRLIFLNIFLSYTVSICIALLTIIVTGFLRNLDILFTYTGLLMMYISELFFYCMAGSYIITESEEVSDAIYNCKWWIKTQPRFRKTCCMIIQRANKTEKLTAGGMLILNLDNFTKILRSSWSFFMLVQAAYNDKRL